MNEMHKMWLMELYKNEIETEKETIANERLWENGFEGDDLNPHTENIRVHEEYISLLENLVEGLAK